MRGGGSLGLFSFCKVMTLYRVNPRQSSRARNRQFSWSKTIRNYEIDTDILHSSLHFWNKSRCLQKCQEMLGTLIFREDDRVVKYGILREKLVLVPRFTYEQEKKPPGKRIVLPKLLLAIEALIILIIQSRM